jgi:hypothetical protein
MGTGYFPGVESGRGVTMTPNPLLVPWSKNRVVLYLYSACKKGETYIFYVIAGNIDIASKFMDG